jgi:hypothetical protein
MGQLIVLFKYINGRTKLKQTWWSTATPEERKVQDKINRRRKSVKRNIKNTTKPAN